MANGLEDKLELMEGISDFTIEQTIDFFVSTSAITAQRYDDFVFKLALAGLDAEGLLSIAERISEVNMDTTRAVRLLFENLKRFALYDHVSDEFRNNFAKRLIAFLDVNYKDPKVVGEIYEIFLTGDFKKDPELQMMLACPFGERIQNMGHAHGQIRGLSPLTEEMFIQYQEEHMRLRNLFWETDFDKHSSVIVNLLEELDRAIEPNRGFGKRLESVEINLAVGHLIDYIKSGADTPHWFELYAVHSPIPEIKSAARNNLDPVGGSTFGRFM